MDNIICQTETHFVEIVTSPVKMVSIVERDTGRAISFTGQKIATEMRECAAKSGAEKTIATYIRLAEYAGCEWIQMYERTNI